MQRKFSFGKSHSGPYKQLILYEKDNEIMGNNNQLQPNPELQKLDKLVGTWQVSGPVIVGTVTFQWMDGGFFLVQHVDMKYEGRAIKGVEYIGYDDSNGICKSHFFDNAGHIFTYDWELEGSDINIWFGRKGSNNRFRGKFNEDGNFYSGEWEWPGGGYKAILTRKTSDSELIETYKSELLRYSMEQLRYVSEQGVWSLVQMYDHLILASLDYLEKVEACASASSEQINGKTLGGEKLFNAGAFPPIKIKLPDGPENSPNNSRSKDDLLKGLDSVLERMSEWEERVQGININYKVKHDGFGWLNAREWFDLVGMHFRHHLRQKSELEQKLF